MRAIWSTILSIAPFEGGGRQRELLVRRSATARRMRLSIDPRDGCVRLTLPSRAGIRHALAWVEERRDWVEAELARLAPPKRLAPGLHVPVEDEPHLIEWQREAARMIRREPGRLVVGGPEELVPGRILRWLRQEARELLDRETRELAAVAGVTIGTVSVGDQRARWGSCTSSGDIRYSWRLILMPPDVRRAIVAHEVAHRLHMDHGPHFHAAVARLHGRDPAHARRWLRAHGSGLHALGRD